MSKIQKSIVAILMSVALTPTYAQTAEYFDSGNKHTADDGIKGDLHTANVGKIVFAKQKIDVNGPASQLSSTFEVGDYVYAEIFLQTCVMNYKVYKGLSPIARKNETGGVEIRIYIDGKRQDFGIGLKDFSGVQATITQKSFVMNGKGDDAQWNNEDFINSLNGLSNGSHTYKVELWGYYAPQTAMGYEEFATKSAIASGEFTVNKTENSTVKLGRTFESVEAKMTDTDIETRALKALKEHAANQGWSETFTQIKITEEDWTIEYHRETGAILDRRIICTALAKWPNGQCTIQSFSFIQDYNGSGYQKIVKITGIVSGSQEQVDCE